MELRYFNGCTIRDFLGLYESKSNFAADRFASAFEESLAREFRLSDRFAAKAYDLLKSKSSSDEEYCYKLVKFARRRLNGSISSSD
ncbi:MAG: hypothetical protein KJ597_05015 [Nanoarchaeota archaeon]|nr:hypothetical protein [Nanoarchaeota archaeon]MBU1622906.1 hypothetical protein [Nanoarchaeota archaeon]